MSKKTLEGGGDLTSEKYDLPMLVPPGMGRGKAQVWVNPAWIYSHSHTVQHTQTHSQR